MSTVKKLKAMAKDRGLKSYSRLNKADLIVLIELDNLVKLDRAKLPGFKFISPKYYRVE